jgi:hypothetical protein
MTTTQTIDGVPRELLERLRDSNISIAGPDFWSAWKELRALLDAPACKRCNGSGWIDNLRPVGTQAMDCPDCKPAAQPQGEPVARVEIGADRNAALTITDENWLRSLKDRGAHQLVQLYAEQPAPVAVVLPERREPTHDNPYLSDADHEWNAYRDELKRLNPSL